MEAGDQVGVGGRARRAMVWRVPVRWNQRAACPRVVLKSSTRVARVKRHKRLPLKDHAPAPVSAS